MKNYTERRGSFKFLHKDYLGSVLAISDEAGNVIERRHFDAWGVFTHLKMGSNTTITDAGTIRFANLLIDRGYTSHEHLLGVDLIHMNGRLYDPLLRRFLNADEHIQDPHNTQNYNKYGYVLNNPLMYNDPSGEFFVAGFFLTWIAPIIWGAIVGVAVGAGLYILQGLFTNNWSWNGFGKSILMGAITGGVAGGLGQVFSTSSFWGSVANGALSGAGTGGVTSLINGTNFLEGVIKGAVIGGAVGAVSYGLGKLFQGKEELNYQTTNVSSNDPALDVSELNRIDYNNEATDKWIAANYRSEELLGYNYQKYSFNEPKGFFINKKGQFQLKSGFTNIDGKLAYALTDPSTNTIYLSPSAYQSNGRFALSFSHELSHVAINNSSYYSGIANIPIITGNSSLNNIGHFAIRYNEQASAALNGFAFPKSLVNKISSSWNFFQKNAPSYLNRINQIIKFTQSIQVRPFKF